MASNSASKTLYSSNSSAYILRTSFSEIEDGTDVPKITASASISSTNSNWESSYNSTLKLYWYDDNTNTRTLLKSATYKTISVGGTHTISATIPITHKSDGTLSGYAYAEWVKGGTSVWTPLSGNVQTELTELTKISVINGKVYLKVNGVQKETEVYGRYNGVWKKVAVYAKANGVWKESV